MKKLVRVCLAMFGAVLLFQGNGYAQQDPQASMYFFNPQYYNPAYCGSRGSINMAAVGRFQWVGWDGAPMTQFFSINMPFVHNTVGVGLHFFNDNIGSRNNTSIFADFAYHIQLNKKGHKLSFGITGGVDLHQYDFNNLQVFDPTDPTYLNSYFQALPNFGAGIYYYGERHYVGVGIPRLLENDLTANPSLSNQTRHFFVAGGYVFNINSVVQFKPSATIKITPNAPLTFDINANVFLFERFWAGAMYRFHESVGINMAYTINNFLTIGYSYDFPINDMRTNQYGSHEVAIMLDIWTKKRPYLSPRYF